MYRCDDPGSSSTGKAAAARVAAAATGAAPPMCSRGSLCSGVVQNIAIKHFRGEEAAAVAALEERCAQLQVVHVA